MLPSFSNRNSFPSIHASLSPPGFPNPASPNAPRLNRCPNRNLFSLTSLSVKCPIAKSSFTNRDRTASRAPSGLTPRRKIVN